MPNELTSLDHLTWHRSFCTGNACSGRVCDTPDLAGR